MFPRRWWPARSVTISLTPTLAVADNGDGTATATIGGTSGQGNTLRRARLDGLLGPLSWTTVGTRSGDGTIDVDGPGYWFWQLQTAGVSGSVDVYQPIIDSAASPYEQTLDSARLQIQSLALEGISANRVVTRWMPKLVPNQDEPPMVVIGFAGGESFDPRMNCTDDIGIPFVVAFYDVTNDDPLPSPRALRWRYRTLKSLRWCRLAGCPEGQYVRPEPGLLVDPAAFDLKRLHAFLPFRNITRSTRG